MGRKRIELSAAHEAEIAVRAARNEPVRTIASALGGAVSVATIDRRVRELKAGASQKKARHHGKVPHPPSTPKIEPAEAETLPDSVPEGTPLEQIEKWMRRIETAVDKAEKDGNLAAFSSLMMRLRSFEDARRKATPIPPPDPNANPDFIELGAQAERRLTQIIHDAFRPAGAR